MAQLIKAYDPEEVIKWPTKRIMALRRKMFRCDSFLDDDDDMSPHYQRAHLWKSDPDHIEFKDQPRWVAL